MKRVLLIALCICSVGLVQAQDIHFSQFYMSPLTLNPALTGNMDGSYRLGAMYRNQWASVSVPFVTTSVSGDAQLFKNAFGGLNYFGVGGMLFNDKSGDGNLTNFTGAVSLAYHQTMDAQGNFHLSAGLQGSYTQRRVDFSSLRFYDQFFIDGFSLPTQEVFKYRTNNYSYFDMSTGLTIDGFFSKKFRATMGFAVFNLLQPVETFYSDQNNTLSRRFVGHLTASASLTHKLLLFPTILYMVQGSNQEFTIGTNLGFNLTNSRYKLGDVFYIGEQYRNGDAAITTVGIIMLSGLQAGISYDVNLSTLTAASAYKGGFELGVQFTGFTVPPRKRPKVLCPRFS